MRTIKQEIEASLTGLGREGDTLTARFLFTEDFIGFQGHFPDRKILPGVCQVQCALTTIEKAHQRRTALKEIMLAKYLSPVFSGEELTCACGELQRKDDDLIVKAVISKNGTKISELKLRFRFVE